MEKRDTLLITGASGHIGRLLMKELEGPWQRIGVDRVPSDDPRVVVADISEMESLELETDRIAVALHFAANPDEEQPMSQLFDPNLMGCEAFLRWCAKHGIPRIVYASSCEAFMGAEGDIPLDAPYAPRNVYGCTKVFGEMICRTLHMTHGVNTLSVRLGAMLPEAMHQELAGDPAYEAVRLPKEEFLSAMQRILSTNWTGCHDIFLGPMNSTKLPTRLSLERFWQNGF